MHEATERRLMSFKPRVDYSQLPPGFSDPVRPAEFPRLELRYWNHPWANRVGMADFSAEDRAKYFGKFQSLPGCQPEPLAMRYHGHQFRHYNSQLGDGRGFLYAQIEDPIDGKLLDFGTKGSGTTPYSRGGDGRLTLKGAMREALATEMLEALGVTTSKTFCFFETGESLFRGDEPSPTRSAVLTRLSHGHIRYGTFQRFSALGEIENLERLLHYSCQTYFPPIWSQNGENAPSAEALETLVCAFLSEVSARAARLAASWMMAGFVHGVLNTDNMNITGESFDYGPWRFLPFYEPSFTAAYFDHEGLYCYGRQAEAVYWNLDQLARALFALAPEGAESRWHKSLSGALSNFPDVYRRELVVRFFARVGLVPAADPEKFEIEETLFSQGIAALAESKVPFESLFFDFHGGALRRERDAGKYAGPEGAKWRRLLEEGDWAVSEFAKSRLSQHAEYFSQDLPEMMLVDEVEKIWEAIDLRDDWSLFENKIERLRKMGLIYDFGCTPGSDHRSPRVISE